ncbi:MAG: ROK family protein [Atopobiaceae bacterium]|nr:ROK family protein [Atopobiaceae bacterium]
MNQLGKDFRAYVLGLELEGCDIERVDDTHITLITHEARGEVNFYTFESMPEIVELRILDADCAGEPKFFLHFELTDLARAQELLDEMTSELLKHELYDTTRVLLCCTAGMTTSLFAAKLTEAAATLSLDYSFEAIPLEQAQAQGGSYDAVLLAPQVGYQRQAVAEAFPSAMVVEIPAKVFASFDVGGALRMLMHLLSDHTVFPEGDGKSLKAARELPNDKRIMVITAINRPRSSWIGWRIYDHGEVVDHGSVTKFSHNVRDVEDLLATLRIKGWDASQMDAIGIAVPGVVNRGTVAIVAQNVTDYELGRTIAKRYGTKVFVDNNANAAAVGCYISQDDYDSVVLHTQQTGFPIGGQGMVVDGHLVKGRKNFAGELGPLFSALFGHYARKQLIEMSWSPEGMRKLVAPLLAADATLLAPDAIFVAVDLLDDMDALKQEMAAYFGDEREDFVPDLVRVTDYRERIALGELTLCLQKLAHPRPHRKH